MAPPRMPHAQARTRSTASTERDGVITGQVLRVLRDSVGLTQPELAEALGVGATTVQSWESGRRGLASTSVGTLARLRRVLYQFGATPDALATLEPALEADYLLRFAVEHDARALPDVAFHPLASSVLRRDVIDLLAWPFTGLQPAVLPLPLEKRRGAQASAPLITRDERHQFFTHLRTLVERARRCYAAADAPQPHRQVYYLMQWDTRPESRAWMQDMEHAERRAWRPALGWTPRWVTARSAAITKARHGDATALRDFIVCGLADQEQCEDADLNYWAYWLDEIPGVWRSDEDMAGGLQTWTGVQLLARFSDRLTPDEPLIDLYAQSTRALVQRRPRLLQRQDTAIQLRGRVETLLDGADLHAGTRRRVEDIRFALQLADR